ncbi:MAG: adenosylcobinamide-GDP ribazoletransferase, partial [Mesorhizobium sp.]
MSGLSEPRQLLDDIGLSLVFFTRLKLPSSDFGGRGLSDAIWAAPFAGLAVAVIGALVYI